VDVAKIMDECKDMIDVSESNMLEHIEEVKEAIVVVIDEKIVENMQQLAEEHKKNAEELSGTSADLRHEILLHKESV
jgi:threonine dehydratase